MLMAWVTRTLVTTQLMLKGCVTVYTDNRKERAEQRAVLCQFW